MIGITYHLFVTLNLHLQQLSYLREVARNPSWSAAAKELHISQPALSQALRELERRLEVTLFERSGRRQRLTATGEEVVAFADAILAQTEDFAGRLQSMRRGLAGRLRVGMIDAACLYVLPAALGTLHEQYPDLDLQLTVWGTGRLLQMLRSFQLDLVFGVGPAGEPGLVSRPVTREAFHIYRPLRRREAPGDARWVLYPPDSRTRALINAALGRRGITPHAVLESSNPQVLRQMVAMGLGWSVLPEAVATEAGQKLQRFEPEPLFHREIVAIRRADAPADPRAERLMALLEAA